MLYFHVVLDFYFGFTLISLCWIMFYVCFVLERLVMQLQQPDITSFAHADLCFYGPARRTSPLRGGYCHESESCMLRYIPK